MDHSQSASIDNNQLNSLVGKSLPDIQLVDKDGKVYTAESFKGKNTVLFFQRRIDVLSSMLESDGGVRKRFAI